MSQNPASNNFLSQDYQTYFKLYHRVTSLYLIESFSNQTRLVIYNTERESEYSEILDTPESLDPSTCIAQLPNGELFCFGNWSKSGIALIIDKENEARRVPSGKPCYCSSGIYFNNNVYCFGGKDVNSLTLILSSKFDLNENRWIDLTPPPHPDAQCQSVIFNGNILVSGCYNRNLLLYSIDIDSFATIPYEFAEKSRKILINIERLYLIECGWDKFIYESEDEYNWKQISKSMIGSYWPNQVYWSYNKGGIYILASSNDRYCKFDLSKKVMIRFEEYCST